MVRIGPTREFGGLQAALKRCVPLKKQACRQAGRGLIRGGSTC